MADEELRAGSRRGGGLRVAVIGAGPGGLCTAIRLKQAGFEDVAIYEKADGIGGTWWHNRYPGAACDVPSLLYSFSFELNTSWSRPYATQPEILRYLEHVVDRYELGPHLRLGTGIRSAHWDEECVVWRLVTDRGEEVVADVVVAAMGMFNDLNWPDVPGLDPVGGHAFAGAVFHSARWDHSHDLTGERVGVIGNAASGVQFLPEIAPRVAELKIFQRSPNWVGPKDDEPFDAATLEAFARDPMAVRKRRWEIWRALEGRITFQDPEIRAKAQAAALANLAVVEDPEVRAKLTPSDPFGTKRPLISARYYPMYNLPHVELVTEAIDEVSEDAITTVDGVTRQLDTIIVATGFATTKYLSAIEVTGRGGAELAEVWSDGPQAYLGLATTGFPNLFMLYGPNTNNGSIIFMIECQVGYLVRQLERMRDESIVWMDVRPDVQERYNAELQRDLDRVPVWSSEFHNYYRVVPSGPIVTQWPHTMAEYRTRTSTPDPDAYEVHHGGRPTFA